MKSVRERVVTDVVQRVAERGELVKMVKMAIRVIEDAERIIEAHSGKDSWIGTAALRKLRADLASLEPTSPAPELTTAPIVTVVVVALLLLGDLALIVVALCGLL